MALRRSLLVILAVTLAGLSSLAALAIAGDSNVTSAGRVPVPAIPHGEGEQCVEDTDFMRRNHMDLLDHQRDETVINGVRTKQHSLSECISCHAVEGADGKALTVASPEHFCRSCHDYAAVKVDCFQCHASRPEQEDVPEDHQLGSSFPTLPLLNGSQ